MYKLFKFENQNVSVTRLSDNTSIPFAEGNTDYANFKADILADKATLQDADGNEMTSEEAKEFIKELP
jgi:hypothetical protein